MPKDNVAIVREILLKAQDLNFVSRYVAPDATYISFTFENPDLRKLRPWRQCG